MVNADPSMSSIVTEVVVSLATTDPSTKILSKHSNELEELEVLNPTELLEDELDSLEKLEDDLLELEDSLELLELDSLELEELSIELEDESDLFELDMYSPESRANGTEEQESEELHAIWKLEEKRREKDKDLLFNTMKENLWGWWD